MFEQKRFS